MSIYFDIKFIRRALKQGRNGEACQASPTCFWSSLINLISKDTYVVFGLSCIISSFDGEKTAKQMKSRRILFDLADVVNALLCKSLTPFNQSERCYCFSISQSSSEIALTAPPDNICTNAVLQ